MAVELIGRREELLAFDRFLEAIPARGQAFLLEGDAGIGKTVLWNEGGRLAREHGFRVLTSRSAHSETQLGYASVGDLLAPVVKETLPELAPAQRRALETALLMRPPDGPPPEVRLLGLALLSVVRALAQDGPLLLALDDVQWVDASSAEVLRFMLRRLEDEPVGVLATVRGRPVEVPLELDKAFAAFQRVAVEPLSAGAIHRLLWGRLAVNLARPELVRVHEIAGGNPFFALELGRAMARGALRADSAELALPESLSALVTERLRVLPTRVRNTLVAVAALAAPSVTLLEPLGAGVVEDIELAQKHGVIELDGDRIHFAHPLLAPASYAEMPLHRRRLLHRRLAELDVDLEERARHLAIAATGPDEEIATALSAAAAHAHARGAALVAAELAERAVALTPPEAIASVNERRITAARHCLSAGNAKKARALLDDAIGSSAPGPIRAEALSQLGGMGPSTEGFRTAQSLYRRALAEPGLAKRQKAHILCELAWMAAAGWDPQGGGRYAEDALILAEELAEPETLAVSLITVARVTFWRTGRLRRDLLDRAIEIAERTDGNADARIVLARILCRCDRHAEARVMFEELIAEARDRGDPWVVGRLFFLAELEVVSGGWDRAARLCDESMEIARQTGWDNFLPLCRNILIQIAAHRGEVERVRAETPDLLQVAERTGIADYAYQLGRALATFELSVDDAESAWSHVEPLFSKGREMDEYRAQVAGSVAIEALIGIGDLRTAEHLLDQLAEHAAGSDTAVRALAQRAGGLLHASRGDQERAIVALEAAAVAPEPPQETNPFELARTLLVLGTLQRQAQHKRAARETLQQAAEIFERLGARLWSEKATSELRRIGGRTASDTELSETEMRIVELVVAGRRNREVAAELNLSPNTVGWNLSKVYRKLGVSSRTELAARISATPQE
ncbi:MAG TPA: AAA family ATPase [Gaiellaceae bacterium]|nr:AAA family ATPase [Gaiellaceae bacterium]